MSGSSSLRAARSEINVTPLVDVILVLLVVFMVITPQLARGFTGKVPPRTPGGGPQTPALVLEMDASGPLRLNRQPVSEEELGERLAAALVGQRDRVLFLKVEDGVGYGTLVRVLDVCYGTGGVQSVAFMLE